jgi:hypothetical protein
MKAAGKIMGGKKKMGSRKDDIDDFEEAISINSQVDSLFEGKKPRRKAAKHEGPKARKAKKEKAPKLDIGGANLNFVKTSNKLIGEI